LKQKTSVSFDRKFHYFKHDSGRIGIKFKQVPNIYYFCQRLKAYLKALLLLRLADSEGEGRDGRAVECGGLENRFPPYGGTGVRIPLSPPSLAIVPHQRDDG
jgi:hypothetical protein